MRVVFIYGPPGSGKTTNAHFLKGKYGCNRIVDDCITFNNYQENDLILCQRKPKSLPIGGIAVHIAEALRS